MKLCAYCGRENEDGTIACKGCGTDLQAFESASAPHFNVREQITKLLGLMTPNQRRLLLAGGALLAGIIAY